MEHTALARVARSTDVAKPKGSRCAKGFVRMCVDQRPKRKRCATRKREGIDNVPRDGDKETCTNTAKAHVERPHVHDDEIRKIWLRAHSLNTQLSAPWEIRIQCVNDRLEREREYRAQYDKKITVGEPQCADCSAVLFEDLDSEASSFKCVMCAGSVGHCGITYDSDWLQFCGHCFERVQSSI